jgi:hypothetical protein
MDAPILFSAASRKSGFGSSGFGLTSSSLSSQTSSGLGITPFSNHNRPQNSPFFNSNGLNIVPTPQGDVERSDMSLAFEVIDRCAVDLQQLQQRYSAATTQLNEATSKALESDARLAQLGAQIDLELKTNQMHRDLKQQLEKQQLPELGKTMRATQELISRLSHLSTSAAAGSATAVVATPKLRISSNTTHESNPGLSQGTGYVSSAITPAATLTLAKLTENGHSTLQSINQGTLTESSGISRKRKPGFEDGHVGSDGNGEMGINSTLHGARKRFAEVGSSNGSPNSAETGGPPSSTTSGALSGPASSGIGTGTLGASGVGARDDEAMVLIRPCLSYNIAPRGCRFLVNKSPCPYMHICLYCGSLEHTLMQCDYTTAEPSNDGLFR